MAKTKPAPDQRIMVRIPDGAAHHRSYSAVAALAAAREAMPNGADAIQAVHPTRTGLAIKPTSQEAHGRILAAATPLKDAFSASGVEAQVKRESFTVQYAPYTTLFSREKRPISAAEYAGELKARLGHEPLSIYHVKWDNAESGPLLLTFPAGVVKPRREIQLMGFSLTLRKSPPRERLPVQCLRCWGFHKVGAASCTRPARCRLCTSTNHQVHPMPTSGATPEVPTCLHCSGPHAVDSETCPLRPRRSKGRVYKPSPAEVDSIRLKQREKRTNLVREIQEEIRKRQQKQQPAAKENSGPGTEDEQEPANNEDVDMSLDPETDAAAAAPPLTFTTQAQGAAAHRL